MRPALQLSASVKAAPRPSRLTGKPFLPLDYFLNRTKALSLYRQFIRATKGLGDASARWETVKWVRSDFERYRDVVESEKVKTLLALGHRQLKQLNATGSLVGSEGAKWRGQRK
ncbi:complex 1 protein [Leucosporidium creatinivorum]|uniref:LYR motif-containing protein 2 n=1 Tax=Leucosporidium creatinivorum TaxID=106004 RepID=A0A1Y2F2D6_9BASI|nr:complex 1 protein [Leucosporidium creatinivorum]